LSLTKISAWNPSFPRKSFNAFHQHNIGPEPWIRYKIGMRSEDGYSYLPDGGRRSRTPRVWRKKK
jgi:hypothetical protein